MAGARGAGVAPEPASDDRAVRAMGEPSRSLLVRHVMAARRPVAVQELVAATGLHHNTVRGHLAVLVAAGLLSEGPEHRRRPGRPRLLYLPGPAAATLSTGPSPYERLAALLAEVAATGDEPRAVGRRSVTPAPAGPSLDALVHELAATGFSPELRPGAAAGTVEVVLRRCPYGTAVAAAPALVCDVHRGIAEGLAGRWGDGDVGLLPAAQPGGDCVLVVRAGSASGNPDRDLRPAATGPA